MMVTLQCSLDCLASGANPLINITNSEMADRRAIGKQS